jgi:hypothetical protein
MLLLLLLLLQVISNINYKWFPTCQVQVQLQRLQQVAVLLQPWREVLHMLNVICSKLDRHLAIAARSNGSAEGLADT